LNPYGHVLSLKSLPLDRLTSFRADQARRWPLPIKSCNFILFSTVVNKNDGPLKNQRIRTVISDRYYGEMETV